METLSPRLDEAAIQHLRASLRGTIVRPGGDDYEAARRIWNGMIDRRQPERGRREEGNAQTVLS